MFLLAGGWIQAEPDAAPPETHAQSATDVQDLLYLGPRRPVVIRLHLFVDGEAFGRTWRKYAHELFTVADQDHDGRLTESERQAAPTTESPFRTELLAVLSLPGLPQCDIDPADGSISESEFAAFLADRRGGSFQAPRNISSAAEEQAAPPLPVQNANAGTALFKALDALQDGQLSIDDLRQASAALRKLDFDSDGACSVDELDHLRSPFVAVPQAAAGEQPGIPLHVLSSGEPSTVLVKRLLRVYQGNGTTPQNSLTVEQLGRPGEHWAPFDADHNARLDFDELRYWVTHAAPDVELAVRIGNLAEGATAVSVLVPPTLENLSVKVTPAGLVSLVDDQMQLEFGVRPAERTADALRQAFVQSFKMVDTDANGYLDHNETARAPYFEINFSRFDRDSDAKVFEEELLAVAAGEIASALSRTSVAVDDRGRDLFEILDTNRDRRVSQRELRDSVDRHPLWDTNSDGQLVEAEVPHLYQLAFERGAPPLPALNGAVRMRGANADSAVMQGPLWFQRMDRNADGDVAFEEFIGTPEQFQKLDTNGDMLLEVNEAVLVAPVK